MTLYFQAHMETGGAFDTGFKSDSLYRPTRAKGLDMIFATVLIAAVIAARVASVPPYVTARRQKVSAMVSSWHKWYSTGTVEDSIQAQALYMHSSCTVQALYQAVQV